MARVWKKHEERRNELLDAALLLFHRQGYDGTTVAAILEAVGVAKGTFYHYFSSKEELLDAIVVRMTEQILEKVREAIAPEGMTAVERFNALVGASIQWKSARVDAILSLIAALYREENLRLRRKMNGRTEALLRPLLVAVVEQGVAEGTFETPDPEEAVDTFFDVAMSVGERMASLILGARDRPENLRRLERKIAHYQHAVERIFGVAPGSLRMVEDSKTFLEALVGFGAGKEGR